MTPHRKNPIKIFQHSFFVEDVVHLEMTELPSYKEEPESYRVPALIVYLSSNSHPLVFEEIPDIIEKFLINSLEFVDYTQMILDYNSKKIKQSELRTSEKIFEEKLVPDRGPKMERHPDKGADENKKRSEPDEDDEATQVLREAGIIPPRAPRE